MQTKCLIPFILIAIFNGSAAQRRDCSKSEYERCTNIADPLVKEAHLVFPDNRKDIDQVCGIWNRFVDCLKLYTDRCFTDQQRRQFNRAVESPIESVHQMCMQPNYQKEYLQYAPCIKSTIVERSHCGPQYNLLVEQVDQGDIISKSTLCCSHDKFKQCVQRETRIMCDRGIPDGPASRFAVQIIEKALSFLQDQCFNFIPNSGDCSNIATDSVPYADRSDPLIISTSSSEVYPWSTIQHDNQPSREIPATRATSPRRLSTASWLPSESSVGSHVNSLPTEYSSTSHLGSRSRPASYGRSSSWLEDSKVSTEAPSTPLSRPWSTQSWEGSGGFSPNVPGYGTTRKDDFSSYKPSTEINFVPETSQETWYPAAGNQLNNEVDEPNQLGLKKGRNSSSALSTFGCFILVCNAVWMSYF